MVVIYEVQVPLNFIVVTPHQRDANSENSQNNVCNRCHLNSNTVIVYFAQVENDNVCNRCHLNSNTVIVYFAQVENDNVLRRSEAIQFHVDTNGFT